ncbi:MAG TPA: hypothetical protein PKD98_00840 [Anaerolineae bacterium]|nr:hypothetical protein [Anaerolineae bacterium]
MATTYLTGPAGVGKTTYAIEQLRRWLNTGIPANQILVILPQLTLAQPYRVLLSEPQLPGSGRVEILTMNGLALRTIELFWPLIADLAGFDRPHDRPVFLSIETAQYFLRQAIAPLLKQGYFDPNVVPDLTISLPRLMSQILDNLNKAALMGLPHTQVGPRLAASVALDPSSRVALEHTQACVNRFRDYCLARNLLDFSLRIETFHRHLWPVSGVRAYLTTRYRYLIVDNVEEDNPFAHDILEAWLPYTEQSLLINDEDAGYRIFLGANWRTAVHLAEQADEVVRRDTSYVAPSALLAFGQRAADILNYEGAKATFPPSTNGDLVSSTLDQSSHPPARQAVHRPVPSSPIADLSQIMSFEQTRFYPQMIDWTVKQIAHLVTEKEVSPGEIVVMSPFISDALRFSFANKLQRYGIATRSHRPSRPLNEEAAAQTVLTLTRLAFPHWQMLPEPFDVTQALSHSLVGLDLIRASLLTQVVYRPFAAKATTAAEAEGTLAQILTTFDQIEGGVRERISYEVGVHYDELRRQLLAVAGQPEPPVLDHFFSRLFEFLAREGFGFHGDIEAGQVIANLIDSARQFRQVAEQVPQEASDRPGIDTLNRAYLETIEQGIAAAQYIRSWELAPEESVLITPATTFLMSNRPVDYQFWLDAGSSGWWERIAQPLTHPYILTIDYPAGRPWTDADEIAAQRDRLARLVLGLTRRCRKHIFITNAEIGEQGYEQRGQLLTVLQQMLRQLQRESNQ